MDTDPATRALLEAYGFVPMPGDDFGAWIRVRPEAPTDPEAFRVWARERLGEPVGPDDGSLQVWWPSDVAATSAADRYEQAARRVKGEATDRHEGAAALREADDRAEAFLALARIAHDYARAPVAPTAMR